MRARILPIVLGFIFLSNTSWAADDCRLDANAFFPHNPARALKVEVLNNSQAALDLRDSFIQVLALRGQAQADNAQLILRLDQESTAGAYDSGQLNMGGFRASEDDVNMSVNIWSSSQDALLSGQRSQESFEVGVLSIEATMRDTASGRVVWQATATCSLSLGREERLIRAMTPKLADALGQTVTDQVFYPD